MRHQLNLLQSATSAYLSSDSDQLDRILIQFKVKATQPASPPIAPWSVPDGTGHSTQYPQEASDLPQSLSTVALSDSSDSANHKFGWAAQFVILFRCCVAWPASCASAFYPTTHAVWSQTNALSRLFIDFSLCIIFFELSTRAIACESAFESVHCLVHALIVIEWLSFPHLTRRTFVAAFFHYTIPPSELALSPLLVNVIRLFLQCVFFSLVLCLCSLIVYWRLSTLWIQ